MSQLDFPPLFSLENDVLGKVRAHRSSQRRHSLWIDSPHLERKAKQKKIELMLKPSAVIEYEHILCCVGVAECVIGYTIHQVH